MAKIEMVKKHFLPFGCPPAILIKDNIQTLLEGIKMTKKIPIIFFFTFANSSFYFWKFGHK